MIQSIAFLTYAVSDIKAARHFYEDILGLRLTHEAGGSGSSMMLATRRSR